MKNVIKWAEQNGYEYDMKYIGEKEHMVIKVGNNIVAKVRRTESTSYISVRGGRKGHPAGYMVAVGEKGNRFYEMHVSTQKQAIEMMEDDIAIMTRNMVAEQETIEEAAQTQEEDASDNQNQEVVEMTQEELETAATSKNMTQKLAKHTMAHSTSSNRGSIKLVAITCSDCGAGRLIKPQDLHQVTRCESCQKKYRNKMRAEKRKEKRRLAKLVWAVVLPVEWVGLSPATSVADIVV